MAISNIFTRLKIRDPGEARDALLPNLGAGQRGSVVDIF
jgi:hypothetical protein